MTELTFVFLGTLATAAAVPAMLARVDDPTRAIFAFFSMICWASWSLQATGITIYRDSTTYVAQHQSLTAIGAAAALIMLLFAVKAITGTLGSDADVTVRQ
jgi:hypothetical protein